jgi:hypothetical protein
VIACHCATILATQADTDDEIVLYPSVPIFVVMATAPCLVIYDIRYDVLASVHALTSMCQVQQ